MFRVTNFEKLLDKATSNLKLEPDWPTIIQICDLIRQGDCPAKLALNNIKKKMQNQNPHVATFALLVLESMVKNCGHLVHDEIATKEFMEQLRDLMKSSQNEQVRSKVLELLQAWAFAFRSNSKYHAVQETVAIMKAEGYKFPPLKESDAMFSADTAPKWVESDVCHRCRVSFGIVVRKHHCRACGNVFCGQCSSKTSTLPKYGIEKEVRVCEACYELHNKPRSTSPHLKAESESLPAEYLSSSLAQQNQNPKPKKTEEELKEEEDIQLALALSQSEAEAKEKEKKRLTNEIMNNVSTVRKSTVVTKEEEDDEDPELARYLNRSYWEKRQIEEKEKVNEKKRSSPDQFCSSPGGPPSAPATPTHQLENGQMAESELNDFVAYLKSQVEIFVNRMKSNSSRGRSISNDSSVQTLFMNVTKNHSSLLIYIHQQDDSRVYYEGLQDKLAQVKDAMMALEALREEHREKLRREAEEAERQKQLQMAHKLEIMRRRKQEYLQYQRQLAIQKMQEQEREMQMRQEQQKQHYLMGSLGITQGYNSWDSKVPPIQPPPSQFGQQYQSLPGGNPQSTAYVIPSASSGVPQQPNNTHIQGMVSQPVIPPVAIPSSGPHSFPSQHPQRGSIPSQRILNVQPNQIGSIPNPSMTPMHIPPTYQGLSLPVQNPSLGPNHSVIPQSQSLVLSSNGPMNIGMPPTGTSNVVLPTGGQAKVNLPTNTPHGMVISQGSNPMSLPASNSTGHLPSVGPNVSLAQGSQQRLSLGHPHNTGLPPQNVGLQQGIPQHISPQNSQASVIPQGGSQSTSQQFKQIPPNGEQSHSSSTGELISFD